ncbi:MAG: hypothetical protein JOZ77_05445 [Candidatus Eremiobacteraeota bacterium]|nr:hypothetical protein [Candidatus Eremiobacteraeota bacterium]
MRTRGLVFFFFAQIPIACVAANCDGASLAVSGVSLQSVTRTPYLNLYHVRATVTNLGNQGQAGNAMQFVDIVQYGARLDNRGIPPLASGASYTVTYTWPRSSDAGALTSPLDFRIRMLASGELQNCASKASAGITV